MVALVWCCVQCVMGVRCRLLVVFVVCWLRVGCRLVVCCWLLSVLSLFVACVFSLFDLSCLFVVLGCLLWFVVVCCLLMCGVVRCVLLFVVCV